MSWISSWWRGFLKRGFFYSITKPWPGEKNLPDRDCWPTTPTNKENEREIRNSMIVDIEKVIQIESSGNPKACNEKSGARGLCQITHIALTDFNIFHPAEQYADDQLFDPEINKRIALWMLEVRIPQLLEYYNLPVSTENILWAYNAGIGRVTKKIKPEETVKYIAKYNALLNQGGTDGTV
ncbi:MAG: lytic transglycosylase domain-containing protein [Candidatus Omnitrophica bacterium]|nr:lytic transglycosylase domain-containing protein [Candidatus Omnitrophota bacterium]